MFIGAFGKGGVYVAEKNDLYDVKGNKLRTIKKGAKEKKGFNAKSYYDLLNNHVINDIETKFREYFGENVPIIYQHDNAGVHLGLVNGCEFENVAELLRNKNIAVLDWPAYSPDLNPIEHCWSLLDRLVKKKLKKLNKLPKKKNHMFRVIKKCFDHELSNLNVQKIFNSFTRRCEL